MTPVEASCSTRSRYLCRHLELPIPLQQPMCLDLWNQVIFCLSRLLTHTPRCSIPTLPLAGVGSGLVAQAEYSLLG